MSIVNFAVKHTRQIKRNPGIRPVVLMDRLSIHLENTSFVKIKIYVMSYWIFLIMPGNLIKTSLKFGYGSDSSGEDISDKKKKINNKYQS